MFTTPEDRVRRAIELHTGTLRALAREAGVSIRLLMLIRDGERRATPRVVGKLTAALDRIAQRNAEAARILRESTSHGEGES